MKRLLATFIICIVFLSGLSGCSGVSKEEYDEVLKERDFYQKYYLENREEEKTNLILETMEKQMCELITENIKYSIINDDTVMFLIPINKDVEDINFDNLKEIDKKIVEYIQILNATYQNTDKKIFIFKVIDINRNCIFEFKMDYIAEKSDFSISIGSNYLEIAHKVITTK